MGNWKNRFPRRFYHHRSPDYPPRYNLHDPLPDYRDDGVPFWEKRYCTKIGKVPWQKIVDTKKLMSSFHGNIVSWDDSAGEEAFQNAKRRYWAEINGCACDTALPDPDMYLDEINWNFDVPGLSDDWEQDILVPDDGEKQNDEDQGNKRTSNLLFIPPEGWYSNPIEADNPWPWESNNDNHHEDAPNFTEGWGNRDEEVHNYRNLENNYNPWKYDIPLVNKSREHTRWGGPDDKFSGLNQWGAEIDQLASYEAGISWKHGEANSNTPYNRCGDSTDNKPCGWNQHVSNNWGYEKSHWNQGPIKSRARGTHNSSYVDKYLWGHKQQEHQNVWPRKPESRRSNWHSDHWRGGGGQKRGSYQNAADHRNQRYQRDGGQRGQYWSVKSDKRADFAPEQPVT